MEPTTAIPIHFTLQALGIAAGALLVAWALVRGRWTGAVGAAMLGVGEGLHAGDYVPTDDDPVMIVLRLGGVALLSIAAVRSRNARTLYGAGAALVVGGTVWGAISGGAIADPTPGAHLLMAGGYMLLATWAWFASRDSVRLRVLTALVGMLAIAVVAGGGAVSRVAALDKRNEQLRQLGSAAQAGRSDLLRTADGSAGRAALLSPLLADDLTAPGGPVQIRTGLQASEPEAVVVVDRSGALRAVATGGPTARFDGDSIAALPVVSEALGGNTAEGFAVSDGRLLVVGAAPVFRAGAPQEPGSVLGAVAVAQLRTPAALREQARAYSPDAEIVVIGRSSAASDRALLGVQPAADGADTVFERLAAGDEERPSASTSLDGVRLVVIGSDAGIVDAATGLLRALLIAILGAALLAVIVALWLSARVTRPILDLAAGAEQVKDDFLASISHELRTPLTPIRGYTELLRRGRVPARRAADYLDEIGEAANRLERIVTLLLDVASQEAGRFRVDQQDVSPAEILGDAAERWAHRGRTHPVRVTAARSLPRFRGDPDVLGRVLDELIDNAIKFSPDGGEVRLGAKRTRDGVELSVADGGIGLTPEQAGELTQAFAQEESGDRRRFGGLGLGLAYVSGVLSAHGSRLEVDSEPGRGTTFSFVLPTAGMVSRMPARTGKRASRRPDAGS